jgi:hypothetical protein
MDKSEGAEFEFELGPEWSKSAPGACVILLVYLIWCTFGYFRRLW